MTVAAMARFFERLGHRVVPTKSAYWYDVHRHFYLSFPFHRLVEPGSDELARLFKGFCAGVRYFGPPGGPGRPSYAFICRDRQYGLELLSPNARSKVRRGLKQCAVERLEPQYARAHGRAAHEDTLRRIRVRDPYPWDHYWKAVEESDCVEVWGALLSKELVAYLVAVQAEEGCQIMVARSSSNFLRFYPNNALLFTVVREMLSRPEIEQVWFGVEALEDASSTDQFKLSMGFKKAPIRQRVVLHPLLRRALRNSLVVRAISGFADRQPQNEFWRKLNGIVTLAGLDLNA
jgi:hypothetical protein